MCTLLYGYKGYFLLAWESKLKLSFTVLWKQELLNKQVQFYLFVSLVVVDKALRYKLLFFNSYRHNYAIIPIIMKRLQ